MTTHNSNILTLHEVIEQFGLVDLELVFSGIEGSPKSIDKVAFVGWKEDIQIAFILNFSNRNKRISAYQGLAHCYLTLDGVVSDFFQNYSHFARSVANGDFLISVRDISGKLLFLS